MNMCCEDCGRDDICLCDLPEPTEGAIQILAAAAGCVDNDLEENWRSSKLHSARTRLTNAIAHLGRTAPESSADRAEAALGVQ